MRYVIRRFLISVLTIFIVFVITFILMHSVPGGPFLGEKTLPANIMHNLQVKYGLDQPMYVQFFNYLKNALVGDFGVSIKLQGRSVTELILMYFPVSMSIGLISVAIAMVTGTMLGILSALKTGRTLDHTVMFIATLGTSIPSFVVGSVSVIIFGVMVRLLPTYGLDSPQSYILPAFALSFFPLSFVARLVRSTMLDVLKQDYIKTARAKGLSEGMVLLKHALKNAILPVVTYLGPLMASVVCGSFVIEKIFTIPGLGKSFVESINSRDYPVIMGTTIFYAAILIFMNFVVDILYVFVDPRIKNSN